MRKLMIGSPTCCSVGLNIGRVCRRCDPFHACSLAIPGAVQAARIYPALSKLVASVLCGRRARGKSMTSLEQALASILDLIEKAKAAGNTLALATLIARKHAICAALAAPEQH